VGDCTKEYLETIESLVCLETRFYRNLRKYEFDEVLLLVESQEKLDEVKLKHPGVPVYQVEKGYTDIEKLRKYLRKLRIERRKND